MIRKVVDRVVDTIVPWRCVVCGLECVRPGICAPCKSGMPWNSCACMQCGLPLLKLKLPVDEFTVTKKILSVKFTIDGKDYSMFAHEGSVNELIVGGMLPVTTTTDVVWERKESVDWVEKTDV